MSKVMLVEDDDSLREIYSIRLTAEGYTIVSAKDGEEALAVAVRERPDLIVSDVMMPKISGFDMLDILRSTPETKDIKVIMMTALSSEDERQRGESLGADRYLVKSQVGIEDVVNAVHEVLGDRNANGVISPDRQQVQPAEQAQPMPQAQPAVAPMAQMPGVPAQTPAVPGVAAPEVAVQMPGVVAPAPAVVAPQQAPVSMPQAPVVPPQAPAVPGQNPPAMV